VKNALALVALMGSLVALPTLARPDVTAAAIAVHAFMVTEGIPAAHVTLIRGDDPGARRCGQSAARRKHGEYLPECCADERAIHVSHLLAQTSGLADFLWLRGYRPLADNSATPIAAYAALGAEAPRRFAPGCALVAQQHQLQRRWR
jgi:hypothetical protein